MGLSASMGRMFLLQQRQNDFESKADEINQRRLTLSKQLEETSNEFSEGKEYIENFTKSQVDTSIEEVPNDTIMANNNTTINRTNLLEIQISKKNTEKTKAEVDLEEAKMDISDAQRNINKYPTTRSQEDIQKDLDKLNKQIEKAPKKYKTETRYPGVSETTYKKENGKKTWSVTLQDGTVNTFKSEKEYNKFLKKYAKKVKVQVETPQLKKLNEQKQKLENELTSAKSRDKLPKLQERAEQFEAKVAKCDKELKELEARKEEEKAKANEKKDTSNNYYYDDEEAAAKAKYDKLQEQIQNRDNKLEMELNNLETQRLAVQREMLAFRRFGIR